MLALQGTYYGNFHGAGACSFQVLPQVVVLPAHNLGGWAQRACRCLGSLAVVPSLRLLLTPANRHPFISSTVLCHWHQKHAVVNAGTHLWEGKSSLQNLCPGKICPCMGALQYSSATTHGSKRGDSADWCLCHSVLARSPAGTHL